MTDRFSINNKYKIVVLSSPGFTLRRQLVLKALSKNRLKVDCLVISSIKDYLYRSLITFFKRLLKYKGDFILYDILLSNLYNYRQKYNRIITPIVHIDNILLIKSYTCEECILQIKKLAPDLLIFAGMPIVSKEILSIPKIGTINGHLGLIPDYRGNYTVHWSLYNDATVGVTVHWVDDGIDTGPIINRQNVVDVQTKDSIESWLWSAEKVAAQLIADSVKHIVTNESNTEYFESQNLKIGKTYRYMPPKLQFLLRKKLINGYGPINEF